MWISNSQPKGRVSPVGAWAGLACVLALLVPLYAEVTRRVVAQWTHDPDYAHGFLVPPLALYFAWSRRAILRGIGVSPNPWGAALLVTGLLQLVLGVLGAELFLQRTSFVVVLAGLVLLILGSAFLRELLFPIAFLLFMVPLPAIVMNSVAFPLQLLAARTATFCLESAGIPALREGNVIVLAQTQLEVAEACSGIRSLQALLCLAAVYGQMTSRAAWQKWALLAAAVPIAILANVTRVAGTGFLAHRFGVQAAEGFYHSFAGLAVFGLALALLMVCGTLLGRLDRHRAAVGAVS